MRRGFSAQYEFDEADPAVKIHTENVGTELEVIALSGDIF